MPLSGGGGKIQYSSPSKPLLRPQGSGSVVHGMLEETTSQLCGPAPLPLSPPEPEAPLPALPALPELPPSAVALGSGSLSPEQALREISAKAATATIGARYMSAILSFD